MNNPFNEIEARLSNIETLLIDIKHGSEGSINPSPTNTKLPKNALTFNEAADYMGISKSYLYKLTSAKKISFYKPKGKMIYFSREELESYLLQNPAKTADEIEAEAEQYLIKNKKR